MQDNYSEKYVDLSPYQYAANNPIVNIDVNRDSIIDKANLVAALKRDLETRIDAFKQMNELTEKH